MILDEGAGIMPISETDTVVVGSSSKVDDQPTDDETDNGYHLDGSEPKFSFSEGSCTQKVDEDDHDEGNGDPSGILKQC